MYIKKTLPDELFSFFNELRHLFIEVVLILVCFRYLVIMGFHMLLVHGAGDVICIFCQAYHAHPTCPAFVPTVPGKERGQWPMNATLRHG